MTEIRAVHKFFPVGQGLFSAGSIEFWPPLPRRRRQINIEGYERPSPQPPFHWVYDCGSSTAKRLVANAIADLKGDCGSSRIDLLTISHFHNDHISGVVELLDTIGAKTVMLPWAPLWHRLLIGFDQGLRADDAEMLFFVDPVQYLIQEAGDGFEQVLFVMPSDGDGPPFSTEPTFEPEPPEDLDGADKVSGPGDTVPYGDLDLTYDHGDRRVRSLRSGQAIPVFGVWEFIPYNDPDTRPSDPTGFEAKVTPHREALLSGNDNERKAALKSLRSLYEGTFGKTAMNDVSLTLYGGAIGTWRGHRYCDCRLHHLFDYCDCWQEHETKAAILLTGDGNLSSVAKWTALERYLDRRRAVRTSVFQVPHHGARANWHDGLAAVASPVMSVFSSDPNHSYGHPHAEVLRDFWNHRPIQVDQHSGFVLHMFLEH
ncbi:MBL fold metallo-hydrolase [Shimia thalassica]|uniref:MBL fold metallo-hydrolase n=1 Tax=Shimia thalassica TaxID=1715693 RepID=UPI001C0971E9|nr:MBL fold metallo-hydrolase [Shimia thalassica]MBU2942930.1 MBL fold metallo-hydrolase [Shimia thalassica]MDO6502747.1 MBL fold metallo-hydrolase [Shimia thalassica]